MSSGSWQADLAKQYSVSICPDSRGDDEILLIPCHRRFIEQQPV